MISQSVGNCAMSRLPQRNTPSVTVSVLNGKQAYTKQISRTRSQAGHYDDTTMTRSEAGYPPVW